MNEFLFYINFSFNYTIIQSTATLKILMLLNATNLHKYSIAY